MPECYREKIDDKKQIVVWDITESEIELCKDLSLSKNSLFMISQRKSIVHRKGYLAIRQILKNLNIDSKLHQYDQNGAPYLTDGRYISISHTKDKAAVVIALRPVGIDLEHYQNKIIKVAPRFIHENEISDPKKLNDIKYITQIWTAKEALYKIFRKKGIHFKSQLLVDKFDSLVSNDGIGTIFYNGKTYKYSLHFRYFSNFCLTLATTKN